jgi:outer membrane protein assembly factor BamB
MSRTFFVACFVFIAEAFLFSGQTVFAEPNLVSHWKFDEGTGTTAYNSAGSNNGTIAGNPVWVTGRVGAYALDFDGTGDYVNVGNNSSLDVNAFTISAWVYRAQSGKNGQTIVDKSRLTSSNGGYTLALNASDKVLVYLADGPAPSPMFITSNSFPANTWVHVAATFNGGTVSSGDVKVYFNAVEQTGTETNYGTSLKSSTRDVYIGTYDASTGTTGKWNGVIDDVRIYNRALSAMEVEQIYGDVSGMAYNPNPANGATGVDPNVILSWSPGNLAASHDVYLGTDYNDVNNADTNSPEYKSNFDVNSFDPCGLELSTTYYWRIDEVNEPNMWKGNVWSFETDRPEIGLSATQIQFMAVEGGANPNSQILGIRNSGRGTLSWQISENCSWLSVLPASGSSVGEVDDVNLSVDISTLTTGLYTCNMTVSDPNASNNPQTVGLTLYVTDADGTLYVPSEYPTIQAAIDMAWEGDIVIVAPGTYAGPGNYDIDFLGKAVTVRSIVPTDPYFVAQTIIDCNHLGRGFYFHSDEDANSILTGLTITNGINSLGGGIYCIGSSPKIANCVISGNSGSGIRCAGSNATITDCIISGNAVGRGGGGGISIANGLCLIYNSIITGNSTDSDGGGIYCSSSSPIITNCSITGNSGRFNGGGIFFANGGSSIITGCTIAGNEVGNDGGGIYCDSASSSKVVNSTISDNSAERNGGGIFLGSTSLLMPITNSIIWGNSDSSGASVSAQIYSGTPTVWFSCIQDDNPDDANVPFGDEQFNIDDDPCFVDPGFWDVNDLWHNGDYHLLPNSPCIETGDSYTYHPGDVDIDGQPRLMGRRVDMGADEFEFSTAVVTRPQPGEVWVADSTHQIKWDSSNITGTIDIYYSDDNGADWIMIDSVPDTGSFTWHLPEIDSNRCLVSVEPNTPTASLILSSSGLFTIHPDSPGPPVASKWKSLGGDFRRSGLSQNAGPEVGCVKWQFQTAGPVSASPTVGADGRIYLPCEDGKLYTIDGPGFWTFDANSPLLSSPSIGPDGTAYVGAENGMLYAIDVNGNPRWTYLTDGFISSSPAVAANGNVFVCSQDGTLYALAPDGTELWTFQTAAGTGTISTGSILASPAIGIDGTIFISGLNDANLYALDPNTGDVKWTCPFTDTNKPYDSRLQPFASPVVAPDGTIYQALLLNPRRFISEPLYYYGEPFWYDSRLHAIDPNNGNIIWSANMTETAKHWEQVNPMPPEPNYWFKQYYFDTYNRLYLFPNTYPYTHTGLLHGFDFYRYYRVSNANWSEPALGPDGTIYVSFDDQYLRAVDPNGAIKWVTSLGWFGSFLLTVGGNGFIYAASDDGFLCVVDPDGEEIARFQGNDWLNFPVITADNTMIVCDSNNTVWAIGGNGCEGRPAALHRPEDLNADWSANFIDFAVMADGWLNCTDTSYDPINQTQYCNDPDSVIFLESDINRDQYVNFTDLAELADNWLAQE